ncbi:hypothetical protein A2303_00775 [Candidatus Falkowbacteria bacterium RIFOXYB2_FULL_47_14]|uniref:Uncharacterized protein n=1 Tax=Candidatus Falkowbacteria bacterium RIFOXYA2_FULL_47_19 TaxID=1797994 RepID=A0A1F5SN21_9BACT|nr:MAG: hypothetical protein A2227_05865 [Candidatus Falkowbacteria bacterium RIFOXYA2_FULL_47_19]OGF35613.1 MAG: hypothetical protein A2468_06300 [Candidatus Falkowbacteria bacterium RIFOXYC2_FULL_46_15]OGF42903.1 MAG: hypothetical protein A2303_00775 [Candidatus Falkowbacteria bacterium RIFOXYB2_FULL_47_14]
MGEDNKMESLKGNCCFCGRPIDNKNDQACEECQEKCEKKKHGNGRHIIQFMFGCFCTRCGKSWLDDF